jgi:hypothetical protein
MARTRDERKASLHAPQKKRGHLNPSVKGPASGRRVLVYFPWSRPGETNAKMLDIDDRFPAIFELRRLFFPTFERLSDPEKVDQGIAGFLDHVQKPNFAAFIEQAEKQTGHDVMQIERVIDDGTSTLLDDAAIDGIDTIVIISFDSLRTAQTASNPEIQAVRRFLNGPDHLIFVCPHHDIGEAEALTGEALLERRTAEYLHHGDRAAPPQQGFGGFARTLLAGLGVPVDNRFGLRPATLPNGLPAPVDVDRSLDAIGVLEGVESLNLHPHLPHLERVGDAANRMDVLARQCIDESAPPHPFMANGRKSFDALLQSHVDVFAGKLLVCDTTLFSSNAGGVDSLGRFWSNVLRRPRR